MKCDANSYLWGAAGDPASRNPETIIMGSIRGGNATQVAVELPNGETLVLPLSGVFGWTELSFWEHLPGLPQAGGTYTCTFLDADGNPIPGAVESDVLQYIEPVEDTILLLRVYPDATVLYGQVKRLVYDLACDADGAPIGGVLDSVANHIPQRLVEPLRIPHHCRQGP